MRAGGLLWLVTGESSVAVLPQEIVDGVPSADMSHNTILVTDNILSPENERQFASKALHVQRLRKHCATQRELIAALKGTVGYILGGVEIVTPKVIASADTLKAIVYTSSNYRVYIPAYEEATRRGIAIANCPGADAGATAEYALTLMLAMSRNLFDIGRTGAFTEFIAPSLGELRVGIIGLGEIGTNFAILLRGLAIHDTYYWSRRRHESLETGLCLRYLTKPQLLAACNVVSIHTPRSAGVVLGLKDLSAIPDGGLVINVRKRQPNWFSRPPSRTLSKLFAYIVNETHQTAR